MNTSKMKRWLAIILCVLGAGVFLLASVYSALVPPLGSAREPARRANCMSNVKQIGLAMAMYAERYQGRLPLDDAASPTLLGSLKLLSNDLTSAKVFTCPSTKRQPVSSYDELGTSNISYSYVPNLVWHSRQSTNPPSIVVLDRIGNSTAAGSRWPKNSNHRWYSEKHPDGGNVVFTDGHVEFCETLPSALKDNNGKEVVLSP